MNDASVDPPPGPLLELRDITKSFRQGGERLEVLKHIRLAVRAGEMVALVGPSGAGKSTLLHIAGLMERPTEGEVWLEGNDCTRLADSGRAKLRQRLIGFVYQHHHLLPEFTALENIMLPQMIASVPRAVAEWRARDLLEAMGLSERAKHRPSKLSGGEQQRVAIARAVANGPTILLADEPTGNLDHATADKVFAQLLNLVHLTKIGAVVATHNLELAGRMDRAVLLQDGDLVERKPAAI